MKGFLSPYWVVLLLSSVLSACGGGGGGGGGGGAGNGNEGGGSPQPEGPRQAAITGENAKALAFAGLRLISFSDSAITMPPSLFGFPGFMLYSATRDNGRLIIDFTQPCLQQGTIRYTGDLAEDTLAGELLIDYQDCRFGPDALGRGRIKITITASSQGIPTTYVYTLENYSYRNRNVAATSNGNIDVRPGADNHPQATSDITVTDDNTGQSMRTRNLVSLHNAPPQYGSPLPAQRSGSIEHSAWGTLDVSTPDYRNNELILKGAQPGTLRMDYLYWNGTRVALDANGDGIYEAFARVYDVDALLHDETENSAPLFTPPAVLAPAADTTLRLPLSGVLDNEADFLRYSVRAVSSPAGVTLSPQLQEDELISLTTGGPGDYAIELTIDDGRGGVTTLQIPFRVPLPTPQLSVTTVNTTMNGGDTLAVDLAATNPTAGPFNYRVVYGPPGMAISPDGVLSWQAGATSLFFPSLDVHAKVEVSNDDHAVTIPVTIAVNNSGALAPLVRSDTTIPNPAGIQNIFFVDLDQDGNEEILTTDNRSLVYTLKPDGGFFRQNWVFPFQLNGGKEIRHILPIDIDGDGREEIVVQSGAQLSVIGESHDRVDRSATLAAGSGFTYAQGLALVDVDNDGSPELFALLSNDPFDWGAQIAIMLDPHTLAERWRSPVQPYNRRMAIGNVDSDPALELVFNNGQVYDGATRASQWVYNDGFGNGFGNQVLTADIDGDGIDEIIGTSTSTGTSAYSAVSGTRLWQMPAVTSSCTLASAQLDGDAAAELLVGGCLHQELRAYDADHAGATQKWMATVPTGYGVNLNTFDLNGDGIDEVIFASFHGSPSLHIYNPATDTLENSYATPGTLNGPWLGGYRFADSGTPLVVFATAGSADSSDGSRLVAIDPASGDTRLSQELGTNLGHTFSFCVADYDNDGVEEILAASLEGYTGFLTAYDFMSDTREWTLNNSHVGGGAITACADVDGDGHTDLLLKANGKLEAHSPYEQDLLWSLTGFHSWTSDLIAADLDADGVPELLLVEDSELISYARQGSQYVERGRVRPADWFSASSIVVADAGDGGSPEIIVAIADPFTSSIVVLDADLQKRSQYNVAGEISALAPSPAPGSVLIGTSQVLQGHHVRMISLTDGSDIWRSPPLLGRVTPRSLRYSPEANGNTGGLIFGTLNAMYITR